MLLSAGRVRTADHCVDRPICALDIQKVRSADPTQTDHDLAGQKGSSVAVIFTRLLCKAGYWACVAGLVLSLAAWVSGQWCRVLVGWAGWRDWDAKRWHSFGVDSRRSVLTFYYWRSRPPLFVFDPRNVGGGSENAEKMRGRFVWVCHGADDVRYRFAIRRWAYPSMPLMDGWGVFVPTWGVVIPCGLVVGIPLYRGWKRERWRQRCVRERLCLTCGYDLRASVERCPECGTEPLMGQGGCW